MAKKGKSNKTMEVEEMNIILRIPKDAASLTVTAVLIGKDDKAVKVGRRLSADDIRSARHAFLDNVEDGDDYDARYVLTDEGREYLEELGRELRDKSHDLRTA